MKKIVVLVLLMAAMLAGCAETPSITTENANVGKEGVYLIDWQEPIPENIKVAAQVRSLDFENAPFAIMEQDFSEPSFRLFVAIKTGRKYNTPVYSLSYEKSSKMTVLTISLDTIRNDDTTKIAVYEIITTKKFDALDLKADGVGAKYQMVVF